MTIIDFHTHFFPEPLFRAIWRWFDRYAWNIQHRVFAEELIERLEGLGVSKMVSLNYAHKPGMSRSLNAWTWGLARGHPQVIPFGTVHPHDEDRDEIVDCCFDQYGFHGLKLHAHVLGIAVDHPVLFPIYDRIEGAGKILMLHGGTGPRFEASGMDTCAVAGAKRIATILTRYPNLKLVIPHLGADEFDACFDLMEQHPNLWMDTTMALAGYFPVQPSLARIAEHCDRILYGSDAPNIPYPLDVEMNNIRRWFPRDIQERLFFRNAQRLLGMEG